jgi:hypothetical protein
VTCQARCYICDPDNPDAPEDGCAGCEADWEAYYYAVYEPKEESGG